MIDRINAWLAFVVGLILIITITVPMFLVGMVVKRIGLALMWCGRVLMTLALGVMGFSYWLRGIPFMPAFKTFVEQMKERSK